jgi:hypothetical protein
MRKTINEDVIATDITQTPEYQKGYRDGLRERNNQHRARSADGILGALLALALLGGVGYLAYSYTQTGQLVPTIDLTNYPLNQSAPERK